jgi:hypothetical protein
MNCGAPLICGEPLFVLYHIFAHLNKKMTPFIQWTFLPRTWNTEKICAHTSSGMDYPIVPVFHHYQGGSAPPGRPLMMGAANQLGKIDVSHPLRENIPRILLA